MSPIEINLRRHSADSPLIGSVPPQSLAETIAVLKDFQNILEELIRIDLAHHWGYAMAFNERLKRVNQLIEALHV